MKITKQRIKEIIKEEIENILNENRIRLRSMDINFHSKDQAQLMGNKGVMAISRQDAKAIIYAIQNEFGRM